MQLPKLSTIIRQKRFLLKNIDGCQPLQPIKALQQPERKTGAEAEKIGKRNKQTALNFYGDFILQRKKKLVGM